MVANGTNISLENSRKSNNSWISDRKFWKIRGAKLKRKKTFGTTFAKIWLYHTRLSSFWKFLKMPFHSLPEGLVEWKAPKSFLGLASYYQRFIPNYAQSGLTASQTDWSTCWLCVDVWVPVIIWHAEDLNVDCPDFTAEFVLDTGDTNHGMEFS